MPLRNPISELRVFVHEDLYSLSCLFYRYALYLSISPCTSTRLCIFPSLHILELSSSIYRIGKRENFWLVARWEKNLAVSASGSVTVTHDGGEPTPNALIWWQSLTYSTCDIIMNYEEEYRRAIEAITLHQWHGWPMFSSVSMASHVHGLVPIIAILRVLLPESAVRQCRILVIL